MFFLKYTFCIYSTKFRGVIRDYDGGALPSKHFKIIGLKKRICIIYDADTLNLFIRYCNLFYLDFDYN